ncbi:MAG: acetyl-CoA carboxylase biotin carboxylase subunit [Methylocystis sp.]|nr:acetyl-CoA carboxylase biotin carboxylase subunit [Methylocystis sp.]
MFDKILIANRGEIALRILRAAKELGVATVAVHSTADSEAMHVKLADESVCIGPPAARDSYLNIPSLLSACEITGADAVHPGYGFLSENARFAEILEEHGITFIGPKAEHIRLMGDKIEAKATAKSLGIPCVPGSDGPVNSEKEALKVANAVGFPVLVKAASGGGGRGMKVARDAQDLGVAIATARTEAKAAFGDDTVYIEKYLEKPRHIEIQIFGDGKGKAVHLGERDCSLQRRHQKVFEESPSPALNEAQRAQIGEVCAKAMRELQYSGAGTIEFLYENGEFYFLEMNTRLQVEHPVTELITGIDLVEQMIRVAAGEPLQIKQSDVKIKGWAVESRIYAEDPTRNFLPSIGRLVKYRPPEEKKEGGVTVRNDTGVTEGREISIHYDPMIAKLVTHGPDRLVAIQAQADALDRFVIDGIRHNIPFLSSLMQSERWRSGKLSTGFIAEEYPEGFSVPAPAGEIAQTMAAVATLMDHIGNERKRQISGQLRSGAPVAFARERVCMLGDARFDVSIEEQGEALIVRFAEGDQKAHRVSSQWRPGELVMKADVDGRTVFVQARPILNGYELSHQGFSAPARVYTQREAELVAFMPARKDGGASKHLLCPMPGLVKTIDVKEGQDVKAGEPLCMVEAMKMENVLRAERDVTVKKIVAKPGDSLAVDAVIMEFA